MRRLRSICTTPPSRATRSTRWCRSASASIAATLAWSAGIRGWIGRRLTDAQIEEYLHDSAKPRHSQHALVQIGERINRGDPRVERWYPRVDRKAADGCAD